MTEASRVGRRVERFRFADKRAVRLWTNEGDTVLSPFAGIGSEGHVAVGDGRRFVGVELKKSYFEQACRNLAAARPRSLFDEAEAIA